jgi:hypothetical protein
MIPNPSIFANERAPQVVGITEPVIHKAPRPAHFVHGGGRPDQNRPSPRDCSSHPTTPRNPSVFLLSESKVARTEILRVMYAALNVFSSQWRAGKVLFVSLLQGISPALPPERMIRPYVRRAFPNALIRTCAGGSSGPNSEGMSVA